jgi:hypothetical protein
MDSILNEAGSGGSEVDTTWDAIWHSAGRITADGYVVEMAIPFHSLRFPGGKGEKKWGFQACRSYPRKFSYFFRIIPWNRARDCTLCDNITLRGFTGASPGWNIELNPTITANRTDSRDDLARAPLQKGEVKPEIGLSTRWGITPNISLNAAINPDFSHVEADAAQLGINKRFALFYPEKRPFFLEGADLFKTMFEAVYTRTIADPSWGFKITGKENRNAFGVLVARDDLTNLLLPSNQGSRFSFLDQGVFSTILRYRRDIGSRSTIGALVADRRGNDYYNSVFGCEGSLQFTAADSVGFQLLRSHTLYPEVFAIENNQPVGSFGSWALTAAYRHEARNWNWWTIYEDLGQDFRADIGFIPRVDTRAKTLGLRRIVWPKNGSWFSRLSFALEGLHIDDHEGRVTDRYLAISSEINGPLQSTLSAVFMKKDELFVGAMFKQAFADVSFSIQPSGSLSLLLSGKFGDAIDYDGVRPGKIVRINPGVGYFFGRHLQLRLDHSYEYLKLKSVDSRLYRANLTQLRLVYQFNTRTFIRAIIQYLHVNRDLESYSYAAGNPSPEPTERHLFTQLLFSYKINPQSLLFLGYSDNWFDRYGLLKLTQKDRTFFIKISYAWTR